MKHLLLLACLGLSAADSEPVWDHLPKAVYVGEDLHMALRCPDLPDVVALALKHAEGERSVERCADGDFRVQVPITAESSVLQLAVADRSWTVALLKPGMGHDSGPWSIDAAGRLRTAAGAWAVLALDRREATEDRRFQILRPREVTQNDHGPCALHSISTGQEPYSGILASILACRMLEVAGHGIVVELPTADAWRGWDHRQYRQAVAWLVADLYARQARRVVLIQPPMVAREEVVIAALRRQIYDVGRSYRCEVLATTELGDPRYWEVAPGVLGRWLNTDGREQLDALCRPYLAPR